jgi:hypothetical protein
VILLILANSSLLALYDFSDRDSRTLYNWNIDLGGQIITFLFLIEATIKIIAMGFIFHPFAYIRDWWNAIDFIIVVTG